MESPLKKMHWIGARGAKGYYVIGAKDGYDLNKNADEQDEDVWDYWETNEEFYGQVVEYYKQNPDPCIDVHTRRMGRLIVSQKRTNKFRRFCRQYFISLVFRIIIRILIYL